MKIKDKLNLNNFFTKEEQKVLLFIIGFTLVGLLLSVYNRDKKEKEVFKKFEKNNIDSIFVEIFSKEKLDTLDVLHSSTSKKKVLAKKSINLNNATVEELKMLPGIGEKTALRIIEYKNKYGKFNKIEDLMKIPRIGQKTFDNIKEYITIE